MMKYNFKRQDAFDFANFIGIASYERHGNLQFRKCPYCGKQTDDKNTFGISLETGQYNCLRSSCGAKGSFFQLARDFDFKLSQEFEEYYKPKKKYRTLKTPEEPIIPKPSAISYLQSRGISEETAKKYEITVQTEHDNILVFPFFDEDGKLKTGIRQLDKLLYGGLPMGGVVLISGRAGQGKSTLASQIMAYAIDQGKNCFAYSGELPNYLFKSWFDMQIAGDRHTYEYQTNQYGEKQYAVSDTNKKMITNWYRGKFFLYDNSSISGDEKESLVKTIDSVVLQYGVEVVLIDNLMTALDLEITEGEKYEKQSLFVKRLARIALKYNILILLVAHKRKSTGFSVNENEEVAGSSDIGNLATVTLAYEKADGTQKDSDGNKIVLSSNERLLKVSKNRLFGRVNTTGWVMGYSEKSKRVYGLGDSLDYEFGWNKEDDGFIADINEETPF